MLVGSYQTMLGTAYHDRFASPSRELQQDLQLSELLCLVPEEHS